MDNIYTLFFVIIGWVFFRADNLALAINYMSYLFGLAGNSFLDDQAKLYFMENKYFYLIAIIFSMPVMEWLNNKFQNSRLISYSYSIFIFILFITAISYIVKGAYNPFIYFNF